MLRTQSLRCDAVLLADAADSLARSRTKQDVESALNLLCDASGTVLMVAKWIGEDETDSELVPTLTTELSASSLLEHWARLVLTLASCKARERALGNAADHLHCFCGTWGAIIACLDPDCARRLLAASPCLSYLITSQLVALCAAVDGGTVYGMPRAPGRMLFLATLARPPHGNVPRLEEAVKFYGKMLALLPGAIERQLQHAPHLAGGATPEAGVPAAASSLVGAAIGAPAAGLMAGTSGAHTVAAHGEHEAEQQGLAESGAAAQRPSASCTGRTAAARAAAYNRTLPLLLDRTVCLEVSLRLATALGSAVLRRVSSAQAQGGRAGPGGRLGREFAQVLADSVPLPVVLGAASKALVLARQLLHDAPSAAARLRRRGLGGIGSGTAAAAPCPPWPRAPSPLECWWEAAVAVGEGLSTALVIHPHGREDELGELLDRYFMMLEAIMSGESREPPAQPSESVAAALSAGFLPCLERLLRAALPLPTPRRWAQQLGGGWDAAWAQMLLFADTDQVAAVVNAAVEGLRMAFAAANNASGSPDGNQSAWQMEDAAVVATRLAGRTTLAWMGSPAAGPGSEPCTPSRVGDSSGLGASASPTGSHGAALVPKLGEPLSLIAARLLPELSRALLGGLMPACQRGDVGLDSMCFCLGRQLQWVPVLADAVVAESAAQVSAAAGNGSGDVGSSSGGGGAMSGGSGVGGSPSPRVHRWRQLLLLELRLPGLLGAAMGLSLGRAPLQEDKSVFGLCQCVHETLRALVTLVPAELARVVAAADRAEAAAAGRAAADGRGPASGAAAALLTPPPSSGLLRSALGPGGPLKDAELLAAVEAACAGVADGDGA